MMRWTTLTLLLAVSACRTPVEPEWPFGADEVPPEQYWQTEGRYRQQKEPLNPEASPLYSPEELAARQGQPQSTEAPLLSWDGGVVDAPRAGAVSQSSRHDHGIEPTIEGRMHIIELYQEVLDERDALLLEVESLSQALLRSEQTVEENRRVAAELQTRLAALEEGHAALLTDNQELAARLTTAQIRRLEAEKLLLENRIAARRERSIDGGPKGSTRGQ